MHKFKAREAGSASWMETLGCDAWDAAETMARLVYVAQHPWESEQEMEIEVKDCGRFAVEVFRSPSSPGGVVFAARWAR